MATIVGTDGQNIIYNDDSGQLKTIPINSSSAVSEVSAPPGPTSVIQSGLIAEYRIPSTDLAGSLIDSSVNKHNAIGTVGSAPTIGANSGGLVCVGTNAISLPAVLNSAKTIQLFVSYQSNSNANSVNQMVAGNSGPSSSVALVLEGSSATFDAWGSPIVGGVRIRSVSAGNTYKSGSYNVFSGTGVISFLMDTNDRFFINGTEVQYFQGSQGSSAGLQTAGNYQLGGANSSYFTGTIYYAVFYNRVLTDYEVAQNVLYIANALAARGIISSLGAAVSDQNNQIVLSGDSITVGFGIAPYSTLMTLNDTFNIANQGIAGRTTAYLLAQAATSVDTMYRSGAAENVSVIWAGTNELGVSADFANIEAFCRQRRALGFKTFVMTMISRGSEDAYKNSLNALIRQKWVNFADGVIDLAANPLLGADGASANSAYFQGDGTHPTILGNSYIAPLVSQAINREFGNQDFSAATTYTAGAAAAKAISACSQSGTLATYTSTLNPNIGAVVNISGITPSGYNSSYPGSIVTASSASSFSVNLPTTGLGAGSAFGAASVALQADVDKYTILGGSSSGQNFTLQSAIGYIGQTVYLKNTNSNSWTVTPWMTETIDGNASATIAAGAILKLQAVLVSASAAGANWISV